MSRHTKDRYEELLASWRVIGVGDVREQRFAGPVDGRPYWYATLDRTCSHDEAPLLITQFAVMATHARAYLTMHVHETTCFLAIAISCLDEASNESAETAEEHAARIISAPAPLAEALA